MEENYRHNLNLQILVFIPLHQRRKWEEYRIKTIHYWYLYFWCHDPSVQLYFWLHTLVIDKYHVRNALFWVITQQLAVISYQERY